MEKFKKKLVSRPASTPRATFPSRMDARWTLDANSLASTHRINRRWALLWCMFGPWLRIFDPFFASRSVRMILIGLHVVDEYFLCNRQRIVRFCTLPVFREGRCDTSACIHFHIYEINKKKPSCAQLIGCCFLGRSLGGDYHDTNANGGDIIPSTLSPFQYSHAWETSVAFPERWSVIHCDLIIPLHRLKRLYEYGVVSDMKRCVWGGTMIDEGSHSPSALTFSKTVNHKIPERNASHVRLVRPFERHLPVDPLSIVMWNYAIFLNLLHRKDSYPMEGAFPHREESVLHVGFAIKKRFVRDLSYLPIQP